MSTERFGTLSIQLPPDVLEAAERAFAEGWGGDFPHEACLNAAVQSALLRLMATPGGREMLKFMGRDPV